MVIYWLLLNSVFDVVRIVGIGAVGVLPISLVLLARHHLAADGNIFTLHISSQLSISNVITGPVM